MPDFIDEPEPGSLKGFLRGKTPVKEKQDSKGDRIYINRYSGKDMLTKEEILDQMSIWTGALLIHECRK